MFPRVTDDVSLPEMHSVEFLFTLIIYSTLGSLSDKRYFLYDLPFLCGPFAADYPDFSRVEALKQLVFAALSTVALDFKSDPWLTTLVPHVYNAPVLIKSVPDAHPVRRMRVGDVEQGEVGETR